MSAQLTKLKARLAQYEAALESALLAQSYSVNGRSKTVADVKAIQAQIDILEARINALENGGGSRSVRPAFVPSSR